MLLSAFAVLGLSQCKGKTEDAAGKTGGVLNIYSSRHYDVDKKVYQDFTEKTGIEINLVEGKGDDLLQRIIQEGEGSEADLYLTVGAESLYILKDNNLGKEFSSKVIENNIPADFRGNTWTAMTSRARMIAYVKDRTDPKAITSYYDLTKPEWKGKILVRSSSSGYNVALLSSLIQADGKEKATEWAKGVVANFARTPKGNDRDQAKAIVAGEGDLAIMNSYYLVRMMNSSDPEEVKVANQVGLIFPEGTHLNLSFAMLLNSSKNVDNAIAFMEYVSTEEVQRLYAEKNGEFALNPAVGLTESQKDWGTFEKQNIDYEKLGSFKKDASFTFDEVGWK